MYYLAITQFSRSLKNLDAILGKAQEFAKSRNFDGKNFLTERLHPDMLPFSFQVRNACDQAKNTAALLAGKEPPKHEDKEASLDDLRARIATCLEYLATFGPKDFERLKDDTIIHLPFPKGKGMRAPDYLWKRQIPNFLFHVTTTYALLRRCGVQIGKGDFLGAYETVDV